MAKASLKNAQYCKSQLLKSKKYKESRDILAVVLGENQLYTRQDVDQAIDTFLKGKVK